MKAIFKVQAILFALFLGAISTGCSLHDDELMDITIPVSYLSIFHAAPTINSMDIQIDDVKYNSQPFKYKNFSGYNTYEPGTRNFKFTPHGDATVLVDTSLNLSEEKTYSMFIFDDANQVTPLVIEDNWEIPTSGKAMIRLINLSYDAKALDLHMDGQQEGLFKELKYKEVSQFKEIDAGRKHIILRDFVTDDIVAELTDALIEESRIYTIIISGYIHTDNESSNHIGMQLITNHTILY
ncbi:MAG: DUF4397 domain-containing protein [Bacteroidota bacterium]|nr:DUF4397 domain-containing protein [Bacteroidota bacterium]MDQ3536807.1 DUF4397 domain-containing protein [Bacteroidota bacterium]